jgi:hypothetical protein
MGCAMSAVTIFYPSLWLWKHTKELAYSVNTSYISYMLLNRVYLSCYKVYVDVAHLLEILTGWYYVRCGRHTSSGYGRALRQDPLL